MTINVTSEIGQLKKVLLHRPGKELEHLVPEELERLLFDDIPYLRLAQQEHDTFADLLKEHGAEVVYLEDLMTQTLKNNPGLKEEFIRQFISEAGPTALLHSDELYEILSGTADDSEMILKTMSGITADELKGRLSEDPLVRLSRGGRQFVLDPIPNLYFTRDPFASIGNGASIHKMYSATRCRETLYGEYILKYHPDFKGQVPIYYDRSSLFSIEGGDILNLSEEVLAIGISQRTTPEAIEILAKNLFCDETSKVRQIIVLEIPSFRAFMHLDTVLTQVDKDKFSVHPEILRSLWIYDVRKGQGREELCVRERTEGLEYVLAEALKQDRVSLISCGGKDHIASAREQWNDGANTLCIAPGKVIVYNRNHVTNEILRDNGVEVFEMPSSALARGRGGPRCMSMPLFRAPVE